MITHMLTGEVPFTVPTEEGKLWAHFSEAPPKPSARVPELDHGFDRIVAKAMHKNPEERYPTAGAVAAAAIAVAGAKPRTKASVVPAVRRDALTAALTDPFNVVLVAALLVVGAVLGSLMLMVPLALLVYGAAVAVSYHNG
jgi:serine/threonine-protein kinase